MEDKMPDEKVVQIIYDDFGAIELDAYVGGVSTYEALKAMNKALRDRTKIIYARSDGLSSITPSKTKII